MAPIYQEISLELNGREYKITPNYGLIQRLEQKLSLGALLGRVLDDRAPLSQLADLLSMALQLAGCTDPDAEAESIYRALHEPQTSRVLSKAAMQILLALLPVQQPEGDLSGKQGTPVAGVPGTSNGENTTKLPLDTSGFNPQNSGE